MSLTLDGALIARKGTATPLYIDPNKSEKKIPGLYQWKQLVQP